MTARRDDVFRRHGFEWHRRWVGGGGGLYVWRTADGRLEAWAIGWTVNAKGEPEQEYRATVDGALVGIAGKLRDVMDRAAVAAGRRRAA